MKTKIILSSIFLCTFLVNVISQNAKKSNAYATSLVMAFNKKHTAASTFHQISKSQWELRTQNSELETLEELRRDEWSIYLKNKNEESIQIDLHERAVFKNNEKTFSITAWDAYNDLVVENGNPKIEPITDQTANKIIVSNFRNPAIVGGMFEYLGDESKQWKFSYISNDTLTGRETIHKEEERNDNVIALTNADGYIVFMDLNERVNRILQQRETPIINNSISDEITVHLGNRRDEKVYRGVYQKIEDYIWEYTETLDGKIITDAIRLQEIGRSDHIIELEDIDGYETILDLEKQIRTAMWQGQTTILGAYNLAAK